MKTIIFLLLVCQSLFGAVAIPEIAGNGINDSVYIILTVRDIDTIQVVNLTLTTDSIIAYRYKGNTILDSLKNSATQMYNIMPGQYELHYRASSSDSTLGYYRVFIKIFYKNKWRDAQTAGYQVVNRSVDSYLKNIESSGYTFATCDSCREKYFTTVVSDIVYTDSIQLFRLLSSGITSYLGTKIYYRGVDNVLDSTFVHHSWRK